MKTSDIIKRAGRNLKRAKVRTLLTSVAIAVGGFAIMASMMAGEGARQYVDRIISSNMDPNGLIIAKDKRLVEVQARTGAGADFREYQPNAMTFHGQEYQALTEEDLGKIKARSDVKDVLVMYNVTPKYIAFDNVKDKKYVASVGLRDKTLRQEVSAGRTFKAGDELQENEAIIPDSFLETLGKTAEEMLGSKITVTVTQQPQTLDQETIAKVFMERGEAGVRELTEGKILEKELTVVAVAKKTAEQINSTSSVRISEAVAKELSEFSTLGTEMYKKYLMVQATAVNKTAEDVKKELRGDDLFAMTTKDFQQVIFTFVNVLQGIVIGFGTLALVVSIFGIVNTMYISVLERTQQIGLMKALGASKRDIARLFRYEAGWVGALGAMIGIMMAWGGAVVFNPIISQAIGFGDNHLLIFKPEMAVVVLVILTLVAILAGFLPSRKAAKLDPIEALRTE